LIRGDSNNEYLTLQEFKDMVRYLVDSHPGLEFLKQPEFQEYYCRTVAIRIMYSLERQQNGQVRWFAFDRSDLPEVMKELDEKDVNLVLQYFSYEHFYVLYCKFWELDTDRDQLVGFDDLCKYGQNSICPSVIKRVVEGSGRPLSSGKSEKLDFEDFVYFCLSEEDKNNSPAVYYWFKVLDVDGDGILSGYELYEFYRENHQRFLEFSESPEGDLSYADMMCQMIDMMGFSLSKENQFGLTLSDLRACPTPSNFFNMVFNAQKFILFEHRDPFAE
ncbi:protein phosphatase 2 (formerly 2A), regulatory subunit B, partial [Trypanosoma cruzi]